MKELKKDKAIYEFSPKNEANYFVEDGEEFWVETEDCFGGQIRTEKDIRPNIDGSKINGAVGPI